MAQALILDSEAVNALANATRRGALADRARAVSQVAYERRAFIRVPAPVLAEVSRGARFDAPINRLLASGAVIVCDLTRPIAQRAGHLLAKSKFSSAQAIDAFVVATALEFDSAVIATADPNDIQRLAAPFRQIRVFGL